MTNRLQKIEKAINNMSDEKFNELLNELGVKEDNQWIPKEEEWYYLVDALGEIEECEWENDECDNYRLLMNNVFKTNEEARAQLDFNFEKAKLIKRIEDNSDVIDWEDLEQAKHSMRYSHDDGMIDIIADRFYEKQGTTYTTNYDFLKNLIETEPERIKKYLFGIGE